MTKKSRLNLVLVFFLLIVFVGLYISCETEKSTLPKKEEANKQVTVESMSVRLKVGYQRITPNLPFYTALEEKLFEKRNLNVEAISFNTSNELAEALITKRVDFTTVTALSVLQSLEAASPGRLKIYQINFIPKNDPNDYLLVKKGSAIKNIDGLKGKKIALYPGSNFNVWAKLIFGEYFGFGDQLITVSLPPQIHAQSLAGGTVDALYCLEPTATIVVEKGIGEILDVGLVCKYIFDPFPVTGNAVLTEFAQNNPETTKKFCDAMFEAMKMVGEGPQKYRHYLTKYCKIPENIASKVKLGHGKPSNEVKIEELQKTVEIYMKHGLLKNNIDMSKMILYPPSKQ